MQIRSVGIDLGKTTFHLVALGERGKVLVRKKFSQKQLVAFTANLQTSLIGLEACSGAHFLGRTKLRISYEAASDWSIAVRGPPEHSDRAGAAGLIFNKWLEPDTTHAEDGRLHEYRW